MEDIERKENSVFNWWNEDKNNENPTLNQLKAFKAAYIIPSIIFLVVSVAIFEAEELWMSVLCFQAECIYHIYNIFKVPLWILATSLPLTGLVAAYHRSVQSAKQIEETIKNNNFSNYYKHIEKFHDRFKNLHMDTRDNRRVNPVFGDLDSLYVAVYPFNFSYKFSPIYKKDEKSGLEVALGYIQKITVEPITMREPWDTNINSTDLQNLMSVLNLQSIEIQDKVYDVTAFNIEAGDWNNNETKSIFVSLCAKIIIELIRFSGNKISIKIMCNNKSIFTIDYHGKDYLKSINHHLG
jgi:hypothetical protein